VHTREPSASDCQTMKRVAVAIVGRGRPQLRKAILAARRAAAPTATPPVNRGVLSTQVEWTDDSARATVPPAFVEGLEDEVSLRMPTADGDECHLVARVGETLLDVAQRHNLNLDGTCAGELACSTCHCVVGDPAIYANLPRKTAVEEDLLASAWDLRPTSRLSCQIQITPEMDGMDVHFPGTSWDPHSHPTPSSHSLDSPYHFTLSSRRTFLCTTIL